MTTLESSSCGPDFSSINISKTSKSLPSKSIVSKSSLKFTSTGSNAFGSVSGGESASPRDPFHYFCQNYYSNRSDLLVAYAKSYAAPSAGKIAVDLEWDEIQ